MRHSRPTVLAASLLGLLAVLAALQYRWLGQLSEAELARLRAGARARTAQFAQEFDREITRAFLWLRVDPATVRERDGEPFATLHERWLREAPHPRLVEAVFWLEPDPRGRIRSFRYDRARRFFAPASLPASLAGLALPLASPAAGEGRARRRFLDAVWEEAPALVHAAPSLQLRPGREEARRAEFPLAGHVVVLFDRTYLLNDFIPSLVRRHFPATEGLEPFVEITSRKDPAVALYRSSAAPRAGRPGDASIGLFAIRLGEANRDLLTDMEFTRAVGHKATRTGFSAVHTDRPRFMVAASDDGGRWRLVLTHRGGSLEDVVAGVRRDNLLVGSGILAVLGAGVLMTIVAAQRAQRLARAEREFVAGISHELSTPLSVICVAGENLADGLVGGGEPVRRYGALIREEGRRLRELVDQVLEFSAPLAEAGRHEPVDLRAIVLGALEAHRTDIEKLGFEVCMDVAPDLPVVMGDAAMLRRAVQNLLSNALKYSGSSRSVGVRIARAHRGRGPEALVTVQDGGLGIDAGEMPRIFDPFYRTREARARQIRGSGLGLSLVRRIVEQHGGVVTVESEPRRGSSFTIRLPAAEHASAGEVHEQAHPAG